MVGQIHNDSRCRLRNSLGEMLRVLECWSDFSFSRVDCHTFFNKGGGMVEVVFFACGFKRVFVEISLLIYLYTVVAIALLEPDFSFYVECSMGKLIEL